MYRRSAYALLVPLAIAANLALFLVSAIPPLGVGAEVDVPDGWCHCQAVTEGEKRRGSGAQGGHRRDEPSGGESGGSDGGGGGDGGDDEPE